jgi:hypothetical protein
VYSSQLSSFLRGRNRLMAIFGKFCSIFPPDEGCHQGTRGSQGGCGGWGTLKISFPEALAPLADELIESPQRTPHGWHGAAHSPPKIRRVYPCLPLQNPSFYALGQGEYMLVC